MNIYLLKNDDRSMLEWIKRTQADSFSYKILDQKTMLPIFYLKDVKVETANIMKQTALSVGCDCSISKKVISGSGEISDMMVMCTYSQLLKMSEKLKGQPFSLEKAVDLMINKINYKEKFIVKNINLLEKKHYLVMGILNFTDDSFYDGSKYKNMDSAMKHIEEMIEFGADIIDIGGESTRPSSEPVEENEEIKRIMPLIKEAKKRFKEVIFSVDTYKSNVAESALMEGVEIINDISGLNFDERMVSVISKHKSSCILVHIQGKPKNMQDSPFYENVILEVTDKLSQSVKRAEENGICPECISVDPGIGFGKNQEHNLKLLSHIDVLSSLLKPICIGVSNKRFIGNILGKKENERIYGTLGANVIALKNKAKIFRVHNVRENVEALKIAEEIIYAGN